MKNILTLVIGIIVCNVANAGTGLGPQVGTFKPLNYPTPVIASTYTSVQDTEQVIVYKNIATPLRVAAYYHCVNFHGFVVTYCVLCNAGVVFVGGPYNGNRLYNNTMAMVDARGNIFWAETGECVQGHGKTLKMLPMSIMPFRKFKREHPHGLVVRVENCPLKFWSTSTRPGYLPQMNELNFSRN